MVIGSSDIVIDKSTQASFVKEKKDGGLQLTHVEYIAPVLKETQAIRETDGWTKGKEFKHMAHIPENVFAEVQNLICPNGLFDRDRFIWWLDNTPEGQMCKTVKGSARHV